MGVPKFFAWLMRKYKNKNFIFEKENSNDIIVKNIDWLLIDTNCLIHPTCFKVLAEEIEKCDNPNFKSLENKMINAVIAYMDKIIKYTDCKKGVYIAIDGPVCGAKMKQQRQRRYRSYYDKIFFDKIKKKYDIPDTFFWSNSSISPGTKFMHKLHLKILDWCKDQKIKILYSSSNTPGEGEHKLLDFIKLNNKNKEFYSYVTYGLDADLIFLMLVTKLDNVYLLRESQQFDNKADDKLKYVSIKIMKECILDTFKTNNDNVELNKDRIINDFIFLCYFLGNDFLPHLYALDISDKGIEFLIKKYINTLSFFKNQYLLSEDTLTINQLFLEMFINKLSLDENSILTQKFNKKKFYHYKNEDPYKKELEKIDNLLFKIDDPIRIGRDSNYRFNYYNYYFGVTEENIEDFVKELVKNYLIGIRWSTYYYFQEIPDWNWFYPYDYPPFLSDINKYMINMNDIKFKKGKPISPLQQLLIILPPQMNFLLPKSLSKLIVNPINLSNKIDYLYKNKYYEGILRLPNMEIKKVSTIFNKNKDKLTVDDIKRNRLDKVFIFN